MEDERLFGRSEVLIDAEPNRPEAHECVKGDHYCAFIGETDSNHVVFPDAERRKCTCRSLYGVIQGLVGEASIDRDEGLVCRVAFQSLLQNVADRFRRLA